jgi:hypothetical protein
VVIWDAWAAGSPPSTPLRVQARRVRADGSLASPIVDVAASHNPHQSDITYNFGMDESLVVWTRVSQPPPLGTGSDIWASRLSYASNDSLVVGAPFSVTHSAKHERGPAVSTNGQDRYIVLFEYEYSGTDTDIRGQELDALGGKVGLTAFTVAASPQDETHPDVVAREWSGADYFATWQRTESFATATYGSIRAWRFGTGVTAHLLEVTPWFWDNWTPAVGTDGVGYLITYAGKQVTLSGFPEAVAKRHIYGRSWRLEATFLPLIHRQSGAPLQGR